MADGCFLGEAAMRITVHSISAQNRRIPPKYLGRLLLPMPGRSERVSRLPRFQSARRKNLRYYHNACSRTLFPTRSFHRVRPDDTEHVALDWSLLGHTRAATDSSLYGCRRRSDWLKTPQENAWQRGPSVSSNLDSYMLENRSRARGLKRNNAASTPSHSHCFSRVRSITSDA